MTLPRTAVVFALSVVAPVLQAQTLLPTDLPPDPAALRAAEADGERAFLHDRAAARATDALHRLRSFRGDQRIRGWVTGARDDGIDVTVFGETGAADPVALYRVRIDTQGRVAGQPRALKTPEPLSRHEADAVAARALAMSAGWSPCTRTYNTVVLPVDAAQRRWRVYLLPGTTDARAVPLGGSYRIDVDLAQTQATVHPTTRTCIVLDKDPRAAALMVTHLFDPTPTAVHVFWQRWSGVSLFVATGPDTLWLIDNGRIRRVDAEAPAP